MSETIKLIRENRSKFSRGLLSRFQGSIFDLLSLVELDLFVGLSPDSFATEKQIEVLKEIPLKNLVIQSFCSTENIQGYSEKFLKTSFTEMV